MSLLVWLPLLGNLENQGASAVTITNNGATINTAGKIGSCYSFDGVDDFLTLNNFNPNGWPEISISAWVYPTANFQALFLARGSSQHRVRIGVNGFMFRDTNSTAQRQIAFSPTISLNTWTHITCIYKRGEIWIYQNGIQTAHNSSYYNSSSTLLNDMNEFRIGRQQSTSSNIYYSGKINDFRIYNHALSAAEVHEISQGLILHYKLDNGGSNYNLLNNSNNFTSSNFALTRSTVPEPGLLRVTPTSSAAYAKYITDLDYADYNNQTFTVSYDLREIESTDETYTSYTTRVYIGYSIASRITSVFSSSYDSIGYSAVTTKGEGWNHYSQTFVLPNDLTAGKSSAQVNGSKLCVEFYRVAKHLSVEIKNIKLEIGNKDTGYSLAQNEYGITTPIIEDSSGYGHNGIVTGNINTNINSIRYSTSTYISSGDTNYITTPTLYLPEDQITINLWFKSSNKTPGSNYHIPLNGTANSNKAYELSIHANGYLRAGITISGNRQVDNGTSTNLTDGNWHMCSITYDGTTIKRYVDGEMEKSTTVTGTLPSSSSFVIGHYGSNTSYHSKEAYMSDVRIYATALSEVDIKQLYEVGARVDNKQNLHIYEGRESYSSIKLTKQGQAIAEEFQEDTATRFYKTDKIIETNNLIEL